MKKRVKTSKKEKKRGNIMKKWKNNLKLLMKKFKFELKDITDLKLVKICSIIIDVSHDKKEMNFYFKY